MTEPNTGINPLGYLESKLDAQTAVLKQIAAGLGSPAPALQNNGFSMPFQYVQIPLTAVNTQVKINCPVNPVNWIQAVSDGTLEGITLWLDNPGTTGILLKDLPTIQTNGEKLNQVYLTSDVRQGRSYVRIYFSQTTDPLSLNYGGQDISLSETAARIGSIDVFDRRGQVMVQDDFSGGLAPWTLYAPSGGSLCVTSSLAFSGNCCLQMVTPNVLHSEVSVYRNIPYQSISPFGLEVLFAHTDAANKVLYEIILQVYDGTNYHQGDITIDYLGQQINVTNETGSTTTLTTAPPPLAQYANFNTMKLVIDPINNIYKRLLINNLIIDLSAIKLYVTASALGPRVLGEFGFRNQEAAVKTAYLANTIFTKNEP